MESWDTFAVIVGGAAAALLGLLFIAISIRLNVVAGSKELRNRSAETLVLFGIVLLLAVLLAIPGQTHRILGFEVIALALLGGVALYLLDWRAGTGRGQQPIGRVLEMISPNTVTTVLLLVAGMLLVFKVDAGMYVLVGPVLAAFVGGLTSAWLFMTRVEDQPAPAKPADSFPRAAL
jgi:Na+/H+ antiporter NhaD/arsenite permease-like protein